MNLFSGLGKTIEMLSVVHSNRPSTATSSKGGNSYSNSTLIITPMSLLSQWKDEIDRCFDGRMTVELYYGNERRGQRLGVAPDVVLTSYGTLTSDFTMDKASPSSKWSLLFDTPWYRIVLV